MEIKRSKIMGIISLSSGSSCWRGLDYYKEKRVVELNKINENEYSSIVKGTNNYNVHLDIEHPRKSSCNCPLANGKRIICKHIVATLLYMYNENEPIKLDYSNTQKNSSYKNSNVKITKTTNSSSAISINNFRLRQFSFPTGTLNHFPHQFCA